MTLAVFQGVGKWPVRREELRSERNFFSDWGSARRKSYVVTLSIPTAFVLFNDFAAACSSCREIRGIRVEASLFKICEREDVISWCCGLEVGSDLKKWFANSVASSIGDSIRWLLIRRGERGLGLFLFLFDKKRRVDRRSVFKVEQNFCQVSVFRLRRRRWKLAAAVLYLSLAWVIASAGDFDVDLFCTRICRTFS